MLQPTKTAAAASCIPTSDEVGMRENLTRTPRTPAACPRLESMLSSVPSFKCHRLALSTRQALRIERTGHDIVSLSCELAGAVL